MKPNHGQASWQIVSFIKVIKISRMVDCRGKDLPIIRFQPCSMSNTLTTLVYVIAEYLLLLVISTTDISHKELTASPRNPNVPGPATRSSIVCILDVAAYKRMMCFPHCPLWLQSSTMVCWKRHNTSIMHLFIYTIENIGYQISIDASLKCTEWWLSQLKAKKKK